jgi:hypothetical protein
MVLDSWVFAVALERWPLPHHFNDEARCSQPVKKSFFHNMGLPNALCRLFQAGGKLLGG